MKSAAAAAQAEVTVDFAASQRAEQIAAGVPAGKAGAGVGAQVGLARRDSPFRGGRYLGLAQALTSELPQTMAALRAGDTRSGGPPWWPGRRRAWTRPTARAADAELGPVLAGLGDREVEAAARAVAYRLDPRAFVDRAKGAVKDRTVTLRPAPDTMSRLGAFLPVAQGVATHTALSREADRRRAAGDQRSRGQIMADTLVERVTGQATADAVPVEVQLVMPEQTLLRGGDEPADLAGAGPVPAGVARGPGHRPGRHGLAAPGLRPTRRRVAGRDGLQAAPVPDGLRRLIQTRDRTCRTPWCGAPIRHTDHVIPVAAGRRRPPRRTGKGCARPATTPNKPPAGPPHPHPDPAGAGDRVEITTPTGHTYPSHPPPLPHAREPDEDRSLIEEHFRRLIHAA